MNLEIYYNTDIFDAIDVPEFNIMEQTAKNKVKAMIRLIKDGHSQKFAEKQLAVYGLLFQYIHRVIVDIKEDLIEEISAVSEIGFEKEQSGEINTQQFINHQKLFKDIHKIITSITQLPFKGIKEFSFENMEEEVILVVEF
jgi:hypothetical protein